MGLFSNKNNQLIAAQYLKIVKDCVNILNNTKDPNVFFERYDLMEQKLNDLIKLSGVHYSGTSPRKMLSEVKNKKQSAIHDMINRYFNDISFKATNLKTEKSKQNKYNAFIKTLEYYYPHMDNNNIQFIKQLYNSVALEDYEPNKSTSKGISAKYESTDIPLTSQQINSAKQEIIKLNNLLKGNTYTAKLKMNPDRITPDSYIRLTPYTEKAGRPSKYPKMIYLCSTVYNGYSVCLYYNQEENIGKGTIFISTIKYSYTIDIKNTDNQLRIMKIVRTDKSCNNETLFHIKADGTVYKK